MNKSERILIISDIHANVDALEAVLAAAGTVDETWCLGDLVGYGPDPNECIKRIRLLPNLICIRGNHDAAALGKINLKAFNSDARLSIQWMENKLTPDNYTFLQSLPEKLEVENVTLAHGSPQNPIWEYLLDPSSALKNFNHFTTEMCFIGHTHVALGYLLEDDNQVLGALIKDSESLKISQRSILNPGSVGQPCDRDARAAFAIYLPEQKIWEAHRVKYNISAVQNRIYNNDLPVRNAIRLANGE